MCALPVTAEELNGRASAVTLDRRWLDALLPAEAERAYNPRLAVPDAASCFEAWPERAAATRRAHPPLADLRYGPHPRETLDLFRAARPRGAVLFIHGGYWRAFSKEHFSWVAEGFLPQDVSVAVMGYPLCPDVALGRIAEAAVAAVLGLHRDILLPAERRQLAVTGHSAGGYLTARLLAEDWTAHGLPADPFATAVPVSGVFALAPLVSTSMNEALRLSATGAARLALHGTPARSRSTVTLAVGALETPAFRAQSAAMAATWAPLDPSVLTVPGRHHFDVIDELALPGSPLNSAVWPGPAATGRD